MCTGSRSWFDATWPARGQCSRSWRSRTWRECCRPRRWRVARQPWAWSCSSRRTSSPCLLWHTWAVCNSCSARSRHQVRQRSRLCRSSHSMQNTADKSPARRPSSCLVWTRSRTSLLPKLRICRCSWRSVRQRQWWTVSQKSPTWCMRRETEIGGGLAWPHINQTHRRVGPLCRILCKWRNLLFKN